MSRPRVWQSAATALWIASLACFLVTLSDSTTAEEALYNPTLTPVEIANVKHLAAVADHWAIIAYVLQILAAATLSAGLTWKGRTRRILVAFGILIGADVIAVLLMMVLVR